MPIIYQKKIMRDDLRANRDVLYVFGDNAKRSGMGGQAREMRGEPNAVGVRTKYAPSNETRAFFREDPASTHEQCDMIDEDMLPLRPHLLGGGLVVWPADGIGTGLADMQYKAPSTWEHMDRKFTELWDEFNTARDYPTPESAVASLLAQHIDMNGNEDNFWGMLSRAPVSKFVGPLRRALAQYEENNT